MVPVFLPYIDSGAYVFYFIFSNYRAYLKRLGFWWYTQCMSKISLKVKKKPRTRYIGTDGKEIPIKPDPKGLKLNQIKK